MPNAKSTRATSGNVGRDDYAAKQRAERRANRGKSNPADWSSVEPVLLAELICAVSCQGAMLTFGYSRDMGAYMLGVYDNGERSTEYCRPSEDVELFLRNVIEDFGGHAPD